MFGNDWDAGLGFNAAIGAIGGGYSGLSAARANGSGIWFGTPAKPSASVIAGNVNTATKEVRTAYDEAVRTQSDVGKYAKENNFFSGQKSLGDKSIVDAYLNEMNNGIFDASKGGAGFQFQGKTIFTDGNHRLNAAIQFKLSTGNDFYIKSLINNGNFHQANPSSYGYKTYSIPLIKK